MEKTVRLRNPDLDLLLTNRGGGIWMGKHYGRGGERLGDPIGNNSHAATVRQLLRFYLLLEQGKPEAAAKEFALALADAPGRRGALQGAEKAAKLAP